VISVSYAARTSLKYLVHRPRPWVVAAGDELDSIDDPERFQSFPSGHALLTWAVVGSGIVRYSRGTRPAWQVGLLGAGATVVSVLRWTSGEHYLEDVVAGAALGLAVGSAVEVFAGQH
jgi:membrane-associated phospholipid phosphatase